MAYKVYILLLTTCLCGLDASAQVSNRQKVIAVILSDAKFKSPDICKPSSEPLASPAGASVMLMPTLSTIPRYSLPKGNVICRFEDYVQMHTPMKLNIGVGGQ